MTRPLFHLNPKIDRKALGARLAAHGRVQVPNVLTAETAQTISDILAKRTRWGLAWQAGSGKPNSMRAEALRTISAADGQAITDAITKAASGSDYAFQFATYPMLDAYLGKWEEGGPHDLLLEHINDAPFLDLMREVTGDMRLVKADAQATLYAPGHFLGVHDDSHVAEGWRYAYVLNLCPIPWRPEWGGYLNFLDAQGDVIEGWKPKFNCLNLFKVPQPHLVTLVAPFAPLGRLAITGWLRDQ
jgi:SM-20-related protein